MPTAPSSRLHRTIWYMGAKARIIPGFVDRVLRAEVQPGGTVVDLMAGTGVVSLHCADRYRVIANDVQSYSSLIAKSLIEHDPAEKGLFLSLIDAESDLRSVYADNYAALEDRYAKALSIEEDLLEEFNAAGSAGPKGKARERWAESYREFLELPGANYPTVRPSGVRGAYRRAAKHMTEAAVSQLRVAPAEEPSCLVTAYYANIYYGLRQSIQIDSLRAAIDALSSRKAFSDQKKTHYLSALLHTASVTTSGTSHFAQPRHLKKDSELAAMAKRRSQDVWEVFCGFSEEIASSVEKTNLVPGNRVFRSDYRDLIRDGRFEFDGESVDMIYMDPPYTSDNYSRFYHVLEVLCRYDYPELQRGRDGEVLRGRYPVIEERFQSGFCKAGRVEEEFRYISKAAANAGSKLAISYSSPTGLLLKQWAKNKGVDPVEKFKALMKEAYRSVRVLKKPLMHSGQGDSNIEIDELLVVCKNPR